MLSSCNDNVAGIEPVSKKTRIEGASELSQQFDINKKNIALSSKRRKKPRSLHNQYSIMKQKAEQFNNDETKYYFENGFRKVYPYYFTFHTFCKGRWLGKSLREIFTSEFRFHSIEHYERARKCGHLLINMKSVESLDVKLKDNDLLSSKLHRHEAPVIDTQIEILHEDAHYLVVNKPSSIPIHPCGRYRNNTLCYVLRKDHGYESLFGCHRLDRLTSGIVIFAKTKHFANKIITEIRERKVEKEYICKVVGEFPSDPKGIICNEVVTGFDRKIGCNCAWKVDGFDWKDATTHFFRLSTDGNTSDVLCKPKTGRTHQIRVHLQYLGFPIVNDPMYNHEAWGEERFKHGPCSRNVLDIAHDISRTYENDAHVMLSNPVTAENMHKVNEKSAASSFEPGVKSSTVVVNSSSKLQVSQSDLETLAPTAKMPSDELHSSHQVNASSSKTSSDDDKKINAKDSAKWSDDVTLNTNEAVISSLVKSSSDEVETARNDADEDKRFCATCPECVKPLPDPDMRWMTMYLHAYRYKGSDWEFQTELPKWVTMHADS